MRHEEPAAILKTSVSKTHTSKAGPVLGCCPCHYAHPRHIALHLNMRSQRSRGSPGSVGDGVEVTHRSPSPPGGRELRNGSHHLEFPAARAASRAEPEPRAEMMRNEGTLSTEGFLAERAVRQRERPRHHVKQPIQSGNRYCCLAGSVLHWCFELTRTRSRVWARTASGGVLSLRRHRRSLMQEMPAAENDACG